jgi:hypothetical protein
MSTIWSGNLTGRAGIISAVRVNIGRLAVTGALQGISVGGPGSINGDGTLGRILQVGVLRNNSDGSPLQPSLQVDIPNSPGVGGFWRFQWGVKVGTRTIQVNCKQAVNLSPRPTMVIKANSGVLASDVSTSAPSGTGWVTIGPVTITALSTGMLWVELHNNYTAASSSPAYFDHIVVT